MRVKYLLCSFVIASFLVASSGCRTTSTTPSNEQAAEPVAATEAPPVSPRQPANFDRDFISNYSLHLVDAQTMTEIRRTCIELDSPNVQLKLVGPGLVFCASDALYATGYVEITEDLAVRSLSARSVTVDPQDVPRYGESDPTKEFGTLPEMCASSVAVRGRSARYVYYSVPNDPTSFSPLHTVVRFDTRQGRITHRLVLENLGCDVEEELGSRDRQIHYLFMRGDGVLVALAGSAAVWVP